MKFLKLELKEKESQNKLYKLIFGSWKTFFFFFMFSRFATKLTDIVFGYTSALFFGGYLCYTYLGSPLLVDGSSMSPELEVIIFDFISFII